MHADELLGSLAGKADATGTNRNEFSVGDSSAGIKTVVFQAVVKGNLNWTPSTSDKTLVLPNRTGTLLTRVSPDDVVVDDGTKGFVLKDTAAPAHYWRLTVSTAGALVTTDLGTSSP